MGGRWQHELCKDLCHLEPGYIVHDDARKDFPRLRRACCVILQSLEAAGPEDWRAPPPSLPAASCVSLSIGELTSPSPRSTRTRVVWSTSLLSQTEPDVPTFARAMYFTGQAKCQPQNPVIETSPLRRVTRRCIKTIRRLGFLALLAQLRKSSSMVGQSGFRSKTLPSCSNSPRRWYGPRGARSTPPAAHMASNAKAGLRQKGGLEPGQHCST